MNVTADLLAALTTNYRVIFQNALSAVNPRMDIWRDVTTIFNSTSDKETYNWLGEHPAMEEWKDKRTIRSLRDFNYTLTNKHFQTAIAIDRDTLEDDKYGLFSPRIATLANAARKYYNEKVFDFLDNGVATSLAYDGGYLFADTRTIGDSGNIDNYLGGNYGESTAEILAGIGAAVTAMAAYKDDWGKPMNLVPDTIVCPPGMEIAIRNALAPAVSGVQKAENLFVKNIISSAWIDAATYDWYFLCTTAEVKPLILQNRKDPEFNSVTNPNEFVVFMQKEFFYGVDARFEVGFGDPRTAILMHNT
jgi:phage major head subunit gpT-like protein